jgi:hypothetical protein
MSNLDHHTSTCLAVYAGLQSLFAAFLIVATQAQTVTLG